MSDIQDKINSVIVHEKEDELIENKNEETEPVIMFSGFMSFRDRLSSYKVNS